MESVLGSLDGDVLRLLSPPQVLHFRDFVQTLELGSPWSIREIGVRNFVSLATQNAFVESTADRRRSSALVIGGRLVGTLVLMGELLLQLFYASCNKIRSINKNIINQAAEK